MSDPSTVSTAEFLQIIQNWWNIFNTKTMYKGVCLRKPFCTPFLQTPADEEDVKITFLKQFTKWLTDWQSIENCNGQLTKDTYSALLHTTLTFMKIVEHSLSFLPDVKYVLAGKFQSDPLERRFGLYRSMAGCNYSPTYNELLECEKKIRIHNIFKHNSENYKALSESNFSDSNFSVQNYSEFDEVFHSDYLRNIKTDYSANVYAGGAIAFISF